MFSISFTKYRDEKRKIDLFTLIIKVYVLFARAIIRSTARASSVFLSGKKHDLKRFRTRIVFGPFCRVE